MEFQSECWMHPLKGEKKSFLKSSCESVCPHPYTHTHTAHTLSLPPSKNGRRSVSQGMSLTERVKTRPWQNSWTHADCQSVLQTVGGARGGLGSSACPFALILLWGLWQITENWFLKFMERQLAWEKCLQVWPWCTRKNMPATKRPWAVRYKYDLVRWPGHHFSRLRVVKRGWEKKMRFSRQYNI